MICLTDIWVNTFNLGEYVGLSMPRGLGPRGKLRVKPRGNEDFRGILQVTRLSTVNFSASK